MEVAEGVAAEEAEAGAEEEAEEGDSKRCVWEGDYERNIQCWHVMLHGSIHSATSIAIARHVAWQNSTEGVKVKA